MKAKVLLDPEKPKIGLGMVRQVLRAAGVEFSKDNPDFTIVVGGDGVFSQFGRTEDKPLLFVGLPSRRATGSKAFLAEVYFDELEKAVHEIEEKRYEVVKCKRLEVLQNHTSLGEVFTDVYLQRGADSNCLRYRVEANGVGRKVVDFAIADGIAVCTKAGSTGYFSYPDRLRRDSFDPNRYTIIGEDEIGICHIVPTYTSREGTGEHPLRYTIPWGSELKIRLVRNADARLYGLTKGRSGIRIGTKDVLTIRPSKNITRLIRTELALRR